MDNFLNTAEAVPIILITLATVGIIWLARKTEKSFLPAILIVVDLGLLLYHSHVLNSLSQTMTEQISQVYICLAMDFLWTLLGFLAYLWIDDIVAVKLNKKSYDNSMRWFWDKL